MRRVVFRPHARQDLDDIAEFIALDNLDRAISFVDELGQACRHRADFPLSGRDRSDMAAGLRSFAHKNYVIYYFVLAGGNGIEIAHVIHGARDHETIMRDEDESLG
ncbi:MAG: type II toxin-antitoxin system RelE/ParE family toxin [Magnetospirillum sp. WYHS-4]